MRRKLRSGFTLAEAMIAILFISIALFGYISLHLRLIHSGSKLEQRQFQREAVGTKIVEALIDARYKDVPGYTPTAMTNSGSPASSSTSSSSASTAARSPSDSNPETSLRSQGGKPGNAPGFNAGNGGDHPSGYNNSGFWADTVPPKGYYDFQGWANTTRPPGYDNFSWVNTTQPNGMEASNVFSKTANAAGTAPVGSNVFAERPDAYASIGGMAYTEAFVKTSTTGLPLGLTHVQSTVEWTDREGPHSYLVDGYERQAQPTW